MCYRPLHIFNPKKELTTLDKMMLTVPCGKCAECRKRKRNDVFVRAFFEYLYTTRNKRGVVLAFTLTYNDFKLPLWSDDDVKDVPVFNKSDIQKFVKRFRKYMTIEFPDKFSSLSEDCIRYLITSEMGSCTHRPHYHGTFFIPFEVSYADILTIKNLITKAWRFYNVKKNSEGKVESYDDNGFVNFGDPKKHKSSLPLGTVYSSGAFKYITKYITKDFDDYDPPALLPRKYMQFYLCSKHFGEALVDYLGLKNNSYETLQMLIDGTFIYNELGYYPYAIPQYITRKILYDYDYKNTTTLRSDGKVHKDVSITYTLNELGKKIRYGQELHSIEFQRNEFDRIFSNIERIINDDESYDYLSSHCRLFVNYCNIQSIDDVVAFVNSTYFGFSAVEKIHFVAYSRLFKERIVVPHSGYFQERESLGKCLGDICLFLDDIYYHERKLDGMITQYSTSSVSIRRNLMYNTYSHSLNSQEMYCYETLLDIFNSCTYIIGLRQERDIVEKARIYELQKIHLKIG